MIRRVWELVSDDEGVKHYDRQIKLFLQKDPKCLAQFTDDELDELLLESDELDELLRPAVNAMLQLNFTSDVEMKALAVSRSVEIAK